MWVRLGPPLGLCASKHEAKTASHWHRRCGTGGPGNFELERRDFKLEDITNGSVCWATDWRGCRRHAAAAAAARPTVTGKAQQQSERRITGSLRTKRYGASVRAQLGPERARAPARPSRSFKRAILELGGRLAGPSEGSPLSEAA